MSVVRSGAAGQSGAAAAGAEPPSEQPAAAGGESERRRPHQTLRSLAAAEEPITIATARSEDWVLLWQPQSTEGNLSLPW